MWGIGFTGGRKAEKLNRRPLGQPEFGKSKQSGQREEVIRALWLGSASEAGATLQPWETHNSA